MIVYKYNNQKYYTGIHPCQKDPISGGFLFPEYDTYTTIEPEILLNKVQKWSGSNWIQIDDNRGIWYRTTDGSGILISEIESSITGLTKLKKPNEDYTWNGTSWILKPESERLPIYKTNKFKEMNDKIISKLMYVKKLKSLDTVRGTFIDEYKKTHATIAAVDASIALIETDLFEA